jgi:hypothetical protein
MNEEEAQQLRLRVKTMDSKEFTFDIRPTQTVDHLKGLIEQVSFKKLTRYRNSGSLLAGKG